VLAQPKVFGQPEVGRAGDLDIIPFSGDQVHRRPCVFYYTGLIGE
jgi:hypothetical protein